MLNTFRSTKDSFFISFFNTERAAIKGKFFYLFLTESVEAYFMMITEIWGRRRAMIVRAIIVFAIATARGYFSILFHLFFSFDEQKKSGAVRKSRFESENDLIWRELW